MTKKDVAEPIKIEISKSDFKKAIKSHKRFCIIAKDSERTPQGNFRFSIDTEKLYVESTDGTSALVSELDIITNYGSIGSFILPAAQVLALSLGKTKQDILYIEADDNSCVFKNIENGMFQRIGLSRFIDFPDISNVLPKNNDYKIKLTTTQIKDISAITSKTGFINLLFNPNKEGSAILLETDSTELT